MCYVPLVHVNCNSSNGADSWPEVYWMRNLAMYLLWLDCKDSPLRQPSFRQLQVPTFAGCSGGTAGAFNVSATSSDKEKPSADERLLNWPYLCRCVQEGAKLRSNLTWEFLEFSRCIKIFFNLKLFCFWLRQYKISWAEIGFVLSLHNLLVASISVLDFFWVGLFMKLSL